MSFITSAQIRGARGMLDWTMLDLARKAVVSVSTIKRLEGISSQSTSSQIHLIVRAAFEAAGVQFLNDHNGVGVRLTQP